MDKGPLNGCVCVCECVGAVIVGDVVVMLELACVERL